jgi:hypothetical protein
MRIKVLSLLLTFIVPGLAPAQVGRIHLPDPKLTPGASLDLSRDQLCNPEVREAVGRLPAAVKRQVFDRYGKSPSELGYNVDHLIPTDLGGSDSIENLWPQPLSGEWSYAMKNRLERSLFKKVCSGDVELKLAQQEIASDWVSAYKKFVAER